MQKQIKSVCKRKPKIYILPFYLIQCYVCVCIEKATECAHGDEYGLYAINGYYDVNANGNKDSAFVLPVCVCAGVLMYEQIECDVIRATAANKVSRQLNFYEIL